MWCRGRYVLEGLAREFSRVTVSPVQRFSQTACKNTVVVERWWQVPLSKEGRPPRLHPRRHRIYKMVEDTKHLPQEKLELILTQTVPKFGNRGDIVFVNKSMGRNKLLPQGLAVYASPENKQLFLEEKKQLQEETVEGRTQTCTGEQTVQFLESCHLEVEMRTDVQHVLTKELVRRYFLKRVNGLDTVRVPMSVVKFEDPKTRRRKEAEQKQMELEEESQRHSSEEPAKNDP